MNSRGMRLATAFIVLFVWLPAASTAQGFAENLKEADNRAWLTNWYDAVPIYAEVEQGAIKAGNRRDAMYSKFGRLRGQSSNTPDSPGHGLLAPGPHDGEEGVPGGLRRDCEPRPPWTRI